MAATDSPRPDQDVFYRETLKALRRELGTVGAQGLEQNRLTHKLCDAVSGMTTAVGKLTVVAEDLRDTVRDFKDEFALMRAEMKTRRASRDRREDTQPRAKIAALRTR